MQVRPRKPAHAGNSRGRSAARRSTTLQPQPSARLEQLWVYNEVKEVSLVFS